MNKAILILLAVFVTACTAAAPTQPVAGATRVREKDGAVMVYVPAGEFLMGSKDDDGHASEDEHPQHAVWLDAFWIDQAEVTNEQYGLCVAAGACNASAFANADRFNGADQPVVGVNWHDAQGYCKWLSEGSGKLYRLPTEAEWEKAARGEDGREWPWGIEFDPQRANTGEGGPGKTTPVGQHSPSGDSPYSAADMAGNALEWVADWYEADYYSKAPERNPQGPDYGDYRVMRGGSWFDDQGLARCAFRGRNNPDFRLSGIGFRCAASPSSP